MTLTGGDGDGGDQVAVNDNSTTTSAVVSYSELLFSGTDDEINHLSLSFNSPVVADYPPKMLCFGESIYGLQYHNNNASIKMEQQTDLLTCINHSSSKKRNLDGKATFEEDNGIMKKSEDGNGAPKEGGKKRNSKKTKSPNLSLPNRHAKVKKVKLGERIVALQKLVSPFGKADTASVLHEAKGYITFLQEQVHILCSPYLQLIHHEGGGGGRVINEEAEVKSRKDLRSKGLCVVPTGITSLHVTDDNGADYWSPANALVNPS